SVQTLQVESAVLRRDDFKIGLPRSLRLNLQTHAVARLLLFDFEPTFSQYGIYFDFGFDAGLHFDATGRYQQREHRSVGGDFIDAREEFYAVCGRDNGYEYYKYGCRKCASKKRSCLNSSYLVDALHYQFSVFVELKRSELLKKAQLLS